MALVSMGCRVETRARVQGSMGMGFQLKLDPAELEESCGLT